MPHPQHLNALQQLQPNLAESAGEYHCSDFDWDELRREVEAQRAQEPSEEAPVQPWQYDPRNWERFHARDNASARFYKERRCEAQHSAPQGSQVRLHVPVGFRT